MSSFSLVSSYLWKSKNKKSAWKIVEDLGRSWEMLEDGGRWYPRLLNSNYRLSSRGGGTAESLYNLSGRKERMKG
jgi:hypothetical protein